MMRALDVAVANNYLAEICQAGDQVARSCGAEKIKQEYSLYGVMFSVADWIEMNSFDSTCGLSNRALKPLY